MQKCHSNVTPTQLYLTAVCFCCYLCRDFSIFRLSPTHSPDNIHWKHCNYNPARVATLHATMIITSPYSAPHLQTSLPRFYFIIWVYMKKAQFFDARCTSVCSWYEIIALTVYHLAYASWSVELCDLPHGLCPCAIRQQNGGETTPVSQFAQKCASSLLAALSRLLIQAVVDWELLPFYKLSWQNIGPLPSLNLKLAYQKIPITPTLMTQFLLTTYRSRATFDVSADYNFISSPCDSQKRVPSVISKK